VNRIIATVVLAGLVSSGCADPEMAKRLEDLEAKVVELETKAAAAPAMKQVKAPAANNADEQAAAALLKEATNASEAMDYDGAKAKIAKLKADFPSTRAARAAQRIDAELAIIGKPAPDLSVEKWFQGNQESLADGTTLVVFWELWCPHCKREVPKMSETHQKWSSKGLNVIGLTKMTRDTTEDAVTGFIKDSGVSYPMGKEAGGMSQAFGVRGIPAAAVVKDGTIIWRGHPGRINDDMLTKWTGS
jgi:thiol-disulfide isomerase/thioredoxin